MFVQNLPTALASALLLSLVSATPVNFTSFELELDDQLIDRAAQALTNTNYYKGQLPSCSGTTNDPSYAAPQTKYKDGDGVYVDWDCEKKSSGSQTCWTEYWAVNSLVHYDGWGIAGAAVDCAQTQTCSNNQATLNQNCRSTGWYAGGSVAAKWEKEFTALGTVGLTVEGNGGKNGQTTMCVTEQSSATCTWDDKKCHTVWKASRIITVYGYMRRRCTKKTKTTQIANADQVSTPGARDMSQNAYTVGISTFDFDIPDVQPIIGCAATCDQVNYPDPTPKDLPLQPWPKLQPPSV